MKRLDLAVLCSAALAADDPPTLDVLFDRPDRRRAFFDGADSMLVTRTLHVPDSAAGRLIGKGRKHLQDLMGCSGAKITIDHNRGTTTRTVTITGNDKEVYDATRLVEKIIKRAEEERGREEAEDSNSTPRNAELKVFAKWNGVRREADVREMLAPHATVRSLVMSPKGQSFAHVWLVDVSSELEQGVAGSSRAQPYLVGPSRWKLKLESWWNIPDFIWPADSTIEEEEVERDSVAAECDDENAEDYEKRTLSIPGRFGSTATAGSGAPRDVGLKIFATWLSGEVLWSADDVREVLAPHATVRSLVMSPKGQSFAHVWLVDVSSELEQGVAGSSRAQPYLVGLSHWKLKLESWRNIPDFIWPADSTIDEEDHYGESVSCESKGRRAQATQAVQQKPLRQDVPDLRGRLRRLPPQEPRGTNGVQGTTGTECESGHVDERDEMDACAAAQQDEATASARRRSRSCSPQRRSRSRSRSSHSRSRSRSRGRERFSGSRMKTEVLSLTNDAASALCGKGGSRVNAIRDQLRPTKIDIEFGSNSGRRRPDDPGTAPAHITVKGSEDHVSKAIQMIQSVIEEQGFRDGLTVGGRDRSNPTRKILINLPAPPHEPPSMRPPPPPPSLPSPRHANTVMQAAFTVANEAETQLLVKNAVLAANFDAEKRLATERLAFAAVAEEHERQAVETERARMTAETARWQAQMEKMERREAELRRELDEERSRWGQEREELVHRHKCELDEARASAASAVRRRQERCRHYENVLLEQREEAARQLGAAHAAAAAAAASEAARRDEEVRTIRTQLDQCQRLYAASEATAAERLRLLEAAETAGREALEKAHAQCKQREEAAETAGWEARKALAEARIAHEAELRAVQQRSSQLSSAGDGRSVKLKAPVAAGQTATLQAAESDFGAGTSGDTAAADISTCGEIVPPDFVPNNGPASEAPESPALTIPVHRMARTEDAQRKRPREDVRTYMPTEILHYSRTSGTKTPLDDHRHEERVDKHNQELFYLIGKEDTGGTACDEILKKAFGHYDPNMISLRGSTYETARRVVLFERRDGQEMVLAAAVIRLRKKRLEVLILVVAKPERKKGYGRSLVEELTQVGREHSCTLLVAWASPDSKDFWPKVEMLEKGAADSSLKSAITEYQQAESTQGFSDSKMVAKLIKS